ncbi:IQ and ubiquitin-like domain-containing protein [Patella vulgata]|uniref:IQ and ubiquitin-like domain-containing protein n=1 Tax=Patella vulgata TaxID=6465 RepID=UPI0024A8BF19|nr:IQ and ubiquitin-like domain-containing protein [Patella vulgata]
MADQEENIVEETQPTENTEIIPNEEQPAPNDETTGVEASPGDQTQNDAEEPTVDDQTIEETQGTEENVAETVEDQPAVTEQPEVSEQPAADTEQAETDDVPKEDQPSAEVKGDDPVEEKAEDAAEEQREDVKIDGEEESNPVEENGSDLKKDQSTETKTTEEAPHQDQETTTAEEMKTEAKEGVSFDATATVKFVLMPSGQVVTLACTLGQTVLQLKEHFSSELKMPVSTIILMFDGKVLPDDTILANLGVGPNGTVQLEMQSADPVSTPIKPYRPRQEYHMPDVITVKVESEDGKGYTDVVVEIERSTKKKPFLGGYRHKSTGIEYLNASAQTMPKVRPPNVLERYCRDTQTVHQINKPQQTANDMATQMTKIGVYVSNMEDKLMVPGKYTSADEFHAMRWSKIVIIQKYYRRWLARRYVHKLREEKRARVEWERAEELRKKKEKEDRIKKEFERRMNPNSKEDFDLLFHALEKWRQEEIDRISNTLTGAERKAALCMLLDQETQLLAAIDRHKLEADKSNKTKRIQDFLAKTASPKKWKSKDGKYLEMDTPYTIRAKELQDIYNSINMKYLTQDERLDVLLTLKHTVKEHDCKLTQEIIELIDREADLLMRGVKEDNLDGLRKRISTLFLQYIKTPTFNPEASKLLKVPQDPSTLRKNIYFCPSCNNYLPSTEFPLSSNSTNVGKCRRCNKIDNDARVRQDFSHYRYMLKSLRRAEETYNDGSEIAFLLQETDLRYLVENIWNGQSVLSAWEDLYDLVMIRWNKHEEWSPWNCILLTKDEASAHDKLSALEEGYGQVFIHKIKQKQTLARNYFSRLPGMAEIIRQRAGQRDMGSRGPSVAGTAVSRMPQKV